MNKNVIKTVYDILCKNTETNEEYTLGCEYSNEKEALENIPMGGKNEIPIGIVKKLTTIDEVIRIEDMCFLCGKKVVPGTPMVVDKAMKYHLNCYMYHDRIEKDKIKNFMENNLKSKLDDVEEIIYIELRDCEQQLSIYKNGKEIKMNTSFDKYDLKKLQIDEKYFNDFAKIIKDNIKKQES